MTTQNATNKFLVTDLITELDLITVFGIITLYREISKGHLQRVRPAKRGRLLLQTPGPVPFVLMMRPFFSELVMSTGILSFEHPSALLFCFDDTTIADRLGTVSWSNYSQLTGVDKPVYGYPTFPLTAKAVLSKGHYIENIYRHPPE